MCNSFLQQANNSSHSKCGVRLNGSSPASSHCFATRPPPLLRHFFLLSQVYGGMMRKPMLKENCAQSGQPRVTTRSAVSELYLIFDPLQVPPGAAASSVEVSAELCLNLDLNIGLLTHCWSFCSQVSPKGTVTRLHFFYPTTCSPAESTEMLKSAEHFL